MARQRIDGAGDAFAGPEQLAGHGGGVVGLDRCAGHERFHGRDLGGLRVHPAVAIAMATRPHSAAQPVAADAIQPFLRRRLGHLHGDGAAAEHEASGLVGHDRGRLPLAATHRRLPLQRRIALVGRALGARGLDAQPEDESGDRGVKAEQERVARGCGAGERRLQLFGRMGPVGQLGLGALTLDAVGGQLAFVRHHQLARGLEHHGLAAGGPGRGDLSPGGDHPAASRLSEHEPHRHAGTFRRAGHDAHKREEAEMQSLGDAIDAIDEQLGEPRVELDEGDAGIRDVVLGPLRGIANDARARL